ncbi:MAG: hypothetical protein LH629_05625 [Ignavibacteria bacterium]|nr:hypothetical protein [Ignavibacteria bacterium]
MSIYKLKVMFEDDENINRDIELRPSDSFVAFEEVIIQAWALPKENKGTFTVSNDKWQKLKVIKHAKMQKTGESFIYPMILQYVDDPHQKFIYESTGKQELTFNIELVIIGSEKPKTEYPRLAKSNGPSPVKKEDVYKHISANAIDEEEVVAIDEEEDRKTIAGFGTEGDDDDTADVLKVDGEDEEEKSEDIEEEEAESDDDFSGVFTEGLEED